MAKQNNKTSTLVTLDFQPIFDAETKILFLGTIPSPKSREVGFYYSHPQNRFWKVLATLLAAPLPVTVDEKKSLLLANHIGIWDVLASCEITNAEDQSISSPKPNDFSCIFEKATLKAVFTTGKKATLLYQKFCVTPQHPLAPIYLPSTSPANCRLSFQELVEAYSVVLPYIL